VVGTAIFSESEMALFSECMLPCPRKLLDAPDIVREAIYQQASARLSPNLPHRLSRQIPIVITSLDPAHSFSGQYETTIASARLDEIASDLIGRFAAQRRSQGEKENPLTL
jgi:hypothetical protein